MKKHEINRFQMIDAVVSYMGGNQTVTASIPVIAEKVNQLISIQDRIRSFEETRFSKAKASAVAKAEARKNAEQAGSTMAAKLYDFGIKTGNTEVVQKYNFTISDFRKNRDVMLFYHLVKIKEDLNANISELESYGVTNESYDEYAAIVDAYIEAAGKKESTFAERSSSIKAVSALFEEAADILTTLDRLVGEFRDKNPVFYNGYKSARVIKDVGYRTKKTEVGNQNAQTQ